MAQGTRIHHRSQARAGILWVVVELGLGRRAVSPWLVGDVLCRVPDLLGGVWQERVPPGPHPVQQHPGVQDHGAVVPHHLHHRGGGRDRPGQRLGHLLHHLLWSAPRLVKLQETKKMCWFFVFLCSKGHGLLRFSSNKNYFICKALEFFAV